MRTEERAEDLGLLGEKITKLCEKKGLNLTEILDLLTILLCMKAVKYEVPLGMLIEEITNRFCKIEAEWEDDP